MPPQRSWKLVLGVVIRYCLIVSVLQNVGLQGGVFALDPASMDIHLQPQKMDIVLVGHQSIIQVSCDNPELEMWLIARPRRRGIFKMVSKEVLLGGNVTHDNELQIRLFGIKPGRSWLDLFLLDAANQSAMAALPRKYEVMVVERVNVLHDAFMYVLLTSQVMILLMLSFRVRGTAVKEVLRRPCALLSAVFCQAILMPLVSIGASVSLSLPIHSVVCLLILGCCPTGMLSPMLAVVQQAHVELALLLTLLETMAAFGIMPLWLFTYGNFLGLAYDHVSGPYFYIAGAMATVAAPLVAGLLIQRCGPTVLPRLDRAIPPICFLLMLMEFTVSAISFGASWSLVTWRLLLGTALLPVVGCILGIITTATFRQKLPQTKTVAIVTCVQNTVLAKVIIQMSYPTSDASVMAVTLNCVEFFTVCFMILAYIPHVILSFCWPAYRPLHQHGGIGGLQDSISDQIVRSMIKAGEITFGKLQQSPRPGTTALTFEYPKIKSSDTLNTVSSLRGRLLYSGSSLDSAYRSNGSSGPGGRTTPTNPAAAAYPLRYFTDSSPEFPQRGKQKRSSDSLESLDYEMLTGKTLLSGGVSTPESQMVLSDYSLVEQEHASPCHSGTFLDRKELAGPSVESDESQPDSRLSRHFATNRTRHVSAASSRSARSDNTQATSVSSRIDTARLEDVDGEETDTDQGISTILATYELSPIPKGLQTKHPWEVAMGNKELCPPPPPLTSPPRNAPNDLLSIEEEKAALTLGQSLAKTDPTEDSVGDSMLLSY